MPDGHLDPLSRATFARSIESLAEEFRGIYSLETIERFVDESIDRMSGARVVDFIPLFVHRFARERLRALAQAQGAIVRDVPEVLFVCVHNAGRSQMAAALLDHHAKGQVHVRSAGSAPADQINPAVTAAMDEWGIDLSQEFPKPLTDEFVQAADVVITMGCGDACPIYPGKRYEDWELHDPAGQPVEVVRRIRDDIDARVQQLLGELSPSRRLTTHHSRQTIPGRLAAIGERRGQASGQLHIAAGGLVQPQLSTLGDPREVGVMARAGGRPLGQEARRPQGEVEPHRHRVRGVPVRCHTGCRRAVGGRWRGG